MIPEERPYLRPAALKFLRGLSRHNDRDWFNERKPLYEAELKAPILAVIGKVNEAMLDFAPDHVRDPAKTMFRIYRDTRFSKDKRPYKDHVGAWWARHGLEKTSGGGFYLQVSATEMIVAAGVYMPGPEQLLAIRRQLLDGHEEFRALAGSAKLRDAGMLAMEPASLARAPKGFPADHPGIDLIRQRQWGVSARLPVELALSPNFADEVARHFALAAPLVDWLNRPLG
jgi:uncharacterized protein (TIGR02453 family)